MNSTKQTHLLKYFKYILTKQHHSYQEIEKYCNFEDL